MIENAPSPAPAATPTGGNNKWLTPAIVIAIIIIAVGGYSGFHRWQQQRAAVGFLKDLGVDTKKISEDFAGYAEAAAKEDAAQEAEANKSSADKFKDAEIIAVTNDSSKTALEEILPIVESVFGGAKITGFTSGYMGMESDSGVAQIMVPSPLAVDSINKFSQALTEKSFSVPTAAPEGDSAVIIATKDGQSFTFSYNKDDQAITVIIQNNTTNR